MRIKTGRRCRAPADHTAMVSRTERVTQLVHFMFLVVRKVCSFVVLLGLWPEKLTIATM